MERIRYGCHTIRAHARCAWRHCSCHAITTGYVRARSINHTNVVIGTGRCACVGVVCVLSTRVWSGWVRVIIVVVRRRRIVYIIGHYSVCSVCVCV